MINHVCDCGKKIEHLLLESLDNPTEIGIDSELEIDNGTKDSFTYVNRLYKKVMLNHTKNENLGNLRNKLQTLIENQLNLGNLRNKLQTLIENQFNESCYETSQYKPNNDDAIALLKEEIEHLKGDSWKKNKVILNLIESCKSSLGSLQDNSST